MSQIKDIDETSDGDPPSSPCRDIVFRQAVVGILPTTIRLLGFILAALGVSALCALFAVMSGFGTFDWGLLTALILLERSLHLAVNSQVLF